MLRIKKSKKKEKRDRKPLWHSLGRLHDPVIISFAILIGLLSAIILEQIYKISWLLNGKMVCFFSFSSLGHIWAIFHVGLWLASFVFQSIQVTVIEKLSIKGDLKNSSHLCLDFFLIHNLRKLPSVCFCIHGEIKTFRCIQEILFYFILFYFFILIWQEILLIGCNIHEVV